MKFELDDNADALSIAAYAPGWIRVRDMRIETPCVVTPRAVHHDLLPPTPDELVAAHFDAVLELAAEIIILGTGKRQQFIDFAITGALAARGVGLEIMDTGAACRSFNVLTAEGRAVAAALYMI